MVSAWTLACWAVASLVAAFFLASFAVGVAALAEDKDAVSILNLPKAAKHLYALCVCCVLTQVLAAGGGVSLTLKRDGERATLAWFALAPATLLGVTCWLWGLAVLTTTYQRDRDAISRADRLLWIYFHMSFWAQSVALGALALAVSVRMARTDATHALSENSPLLS